MKPNLGLSDSQRSDVVGILTTLLADEYVLYTKTRNYHWNVVGHQFHDLHKFFEEQYEALDEVVDDVAERARSLGGPSAGTLKEFLGATRLKESPGESPD
ncbi:MAG: Dps family protein, partial [Planctomycetota bacterium]